MFDCLEDISLWFKDEMDLYKCMMDKLWQNCFEFQKEWEVMQEFIEDLWKELEYLQMYKLDCEWLGRGCSVFFGLGEFNVRVCEVEFEYEVKWFKQENYKLWDQNDDLNGQILSFSFYEVKNFFVVQIKVQFLVVEIDIVLCDELMEVFKEQEEINFWLRQYMDKIIFVILDYNFFIFEIKY